MGKSHPLLNWEWNAISRFNKCALFLAQHARRAPCSVTPQPFGSALQNAICRSVKSAGRAIFVRVKDKPNLKSRVSTMPLVCPCYTPPRLSCIHATLHHASRVSMLHSTTPLVYPFYTLPRLPCIHSTLHHASRVSILHSTMPPVYPCYTLPCLPCIHATLHHASRVSMLHSTR